ncbi:Pathogenesis-related protein PR-4A [Linum grandiflorum]
MQRVGVALLLILCSLVAIASGQSASGVRSTYHLYNPELHNWDLNEVRGYCATWDASQPLSWRQRLDSNGAGYTNGHLFVDYEFVSCGD